MKTYAERVKYYAEELVRWNKSINLIGASTERDVLTRHIQESERLLSLLPLQFQRIIDIGSGAGIPGIILAMTGRHEVHLVESDQKKAAFLEHLRMRMDLTCVIHARRIESLSTLQADTVVARACAPLQKLFVYACPHLAQKGQMWFYKGKNYAQEVADARKQWCFSCKMHSVRSDSKDSVLLNITDLKPLEQSATPSGMSADDQ